MSLIRKFLESGVMESEHYQPTKVGTSQGENLSPLFSNIMLNELDKELEARGLNFVRYAYDCMIFVKSEKAANTVKLSMMGDTFHKNKKFCSKLPLSRWNSGDFR